MLFAKQRKAFISVMPIIPIIIMMNDTTDRTHQDESL